MDVEAAQFTADDQGHHRGIESPGEGASGFVRSEAFDRLARTGSTMPIRGGAGVDRLDEGLFGPSTWVGPGLEQVIQTLVAKALDITCRKGGSGHDLGDEIESGREPFAGNIDRDGQRIPTGLGVERRAQPLGCLDKLDRVVVVGAFGQGSGHQDRGSRLRLGIVSRATQRDQDASEQRPCGQVDRDHGQAVVKPRPIDGRERVWPGYAGMRALP